MKFQYKGSPVQNYYGLNLCDGEIYDVPSELNNKFKSNPAMTEVRATKKKKAKAKAEDKGDDKS